jgi:hypothetical protein
VAHAQVDAQWPELTPSSVRSAAMRAHWARSPRPGVDFIYIAPLNSKQNEPHGIDLTHF